MTDDAELLRSIKTRLDQHEDPVSVINSLLPKTAAEARTWARRLTLFPEYHEQFGPQTVGIARTISKRAMREHGLLLSEDGRIIEDCGIERRDLNSKPTRVGMLPGILLLGPSLPRKMIACRSSRTGVAAPVSLF